MKLDFHIQDATVLAKIPNRIQVPVNFQNFQVAKVITEFAQSLRELRLRHICMDFGLFCEEFWKAVGQCQQLEQFQYETCRLDSFSHLHLQQALHGKRLVYVIKFYSDNSFHFYHFL